MSETTSTAVKTHISLNVRNIEHSVAFYEMFFGVSAHKRRPGYANFDIAQPPLKLALQEGTVQVGVGSLSHLGIQVPNAEVLQAARQRMELSGMISLDEGDTVCCYARQDKIWATDPDGNGWEIYLLLDEMDDHEDDHFIELGAGHTRPNLANNADCCAAPSDSNSCC